MLEVVRPAPQPIEVEGTFYVPDGAPRPEYVIPDEVVAFCARRWGLLEKDENNMPKWRGIDPLCGYGTIPRVINKEGGWCRGGELDELTFNIARTVVPSLTARVPDQYLRPIFIGGGVTRAAEVPVRPVVGGDCTQINPSNYNLGGDRRWHYIYTSIPFYMVLEERLDYSSAGIFAAFQRALQPGGCIIIDSADRAIRNGEMVNPAAATIGHFERWGFIPLDRIECSVTNAPSGCDNQFTELLFVRKYEQRLAREKMLAESHPWPVRQM